ncbi:CrcB family protein [Methanonatronarchaeum sp. AMET6-2]|uniref:fluoride efflux transporter FluC n=1 Tax=Methanonatronarchaeum sp. AMET6-2 TaxID=2933293 RepID=UPI001221AB41|nr:CrcB family protein [Methanonatronarchaeum sp. AMET6-2]RZN61707.1 MAG: CrcB family protein [Methanonatronarchaeia archaeon]UOY10137.1 CrcB family protein [Methanonatronarchaeum sp. AMET6-2]
MDIDRFYSGVWLVFLVGIGGFLGACLRYIFDLWVGGLASTLLVNSLGSFILGLVVFYSLVRRSLSEGFVALVATGILSSFTTYSTFALQSFTSSPMVMFLNIILNYGLGLFGAYLGSVFVKRFVGGI